MYWLATCPVVLLNAHLAMLPRLRAEESLLQVRVSSLGSGFVPKATSQPVLDQWERTANGVSGAQAKPSMPEMTPEVRALMGLDSPVQVVV